MRVLDRCFLLKSIYILFLRDRLVMSSPDYITFMYVFQWHLTHKDSKWNTLLVTLYFLGVVLGSLPAGLLADRFGRRVVMLTCFYCQGALSIGIVYCTSFTLYAVMRTLQGLFVQVSKYSIFHY